MNNKVLFIALGAAAITLTGCSKKLGQFKSEFFSTNPTPLESVGQTVPGTVTGNLPAKFMVKNARVTATPVIEWDNGRAEGTPVMIQGENVRANGQVISYANGGRFNVPFNILYQPEMESSSLYLTFDVDQNGKIYTLPPVKVGYGVVATSTLASAKTVAPAIAKDKFQKVITERYTADIHFLINQANIRSSETNATDYIDLNRRLIEAKYFRAELGIVIKDESRNMGYASSAIHKIQQYASEILHLHQLYAYVGTNNEASLKLFDKSGFQKAGLLKEWVLEGHAYQDVWLMQYLL